MDLAAVGLSPDSASPGEATREKELEPKSKDDAAKIKAQLESAGATVELK